MPAHLKILCLRALLGAGFIAFPLLSFEPLAAGQVEPAKRWVQIQGNIPDGVYGTLGVPSVANRPPGRAGAATWTDSSGNFWLFGGEVNTSDEIGWGLSNDLWEFNPSTQEWTWRAGNVVGQGWEGVWGTLGIPAIGNTPPGRAGSVSWTDAAGNFWLFGGENRDGTLGDLWKFNPTAHQWTWMGGSALYGQSGIYGVKGEAAAGNIPGSRGLAAAWTDSSGNFWLFGGQGADADGNDTPLNDLWKFDPLKNQWTWIAGMSTAPCGDFICGWAGIYGTLGEPASSNAPGNRSDATGWIDNSGNLWLFGGSGNDGNSTFGHLNDVWKFDLQTLEWTWEGGATTIDQPGISGTLGAPGAGNIPGSRVGALGWTDADGNFWLVGGYGVGTDGAAGDLNDTWEFFPRTNEWAWMGGSSVASQRGTSVTYSPATRYGSANWTDNKGRLWLFGGVLGWIQNNRLLFTNDLWLYEPPPPFGNLDQAVDSTTSSTTVGQSDSLLIRGWAAGSTDGAPLGNIRVYIDGSLVGTPTAEIARPDVAAAFQDAGLTSAGYEFLYPAAALTVGQHLATVVATDANAESTTFGPLSFTVALAAGPRPPFGNLDEAVDSATGSSVIQMVMGSLLVRGWAADATDGAPLSNVQVSIDGAAVGTPTLGISRPDVAAATGNAAYANSGYELLYALPVVSPGQHRVSVLARNSQGSFTTFGPLSFTAEIGPPFGHLDQAVDSITSSAQIAQSNSLRVSGWVADAADGAPLSDVKVYIDGVLAGTPTVGLPRADVAAVSRYSAYLNSGYKLLYSAATLSIGSHLVTVIATNSAGRTAIFGPLTFSVAAVAGASAPFGNLDQAVDSVTLSTTIRHGDSLLVRGWAADEADGAPLSNVKVYVDGVLAGTPTLGIPRPDVATNLHDAALTNAGFQLTCSISTLSVGTHSVTVLAINSGGQSTTLGPVAFTQE